MKNFYIYLIAVLMSSFGFSQSEITITTSGGSFPGEKWVSITTAIDGGGTQVYGQGNGTQCDGAGLLTNELVTLAAGTYYVNCYDQYDDSWDGTLITVEAYGSTIGDNGGVTPDDGLDSDLTTGCEGTPEELEASFVIIVPAPPACLAPSAITVDSFDSTTADISWTANSAELDWEIAVQAAGTGAPAAADNSGTDTTTNPHSTTGLTPATAYEIYVRADCSAGAGTGLSSWAGPVNFTTLCTVETAPYTEDFENAGAVPICWTLAGDDTWLFNTAGPNHVGNGGTLSGATASGNYYAVMDDSDPSSLTGELRSPFVDLTPLTTPALSFYEISDNEGLGGNATLTVDVYDGAAWNNVGTYNTNTSGWEQKFIDLSGLTFTGPAQARFIIADSGSFYDDIAIDDVKFDEFPSCFSPTALAIDSFNASSASISWTAGASAETAWEIVVQADGLGEPAGAGTATTSNSPHFQLGLTGSTAYEVYVRADCGGSDYSDWIGPVDFTTLPSVAPTCSATVTSTPDASCGNFDTAISWDASAIADGYRITVGTTTGANDILDNVDLGNVLTTNVSGQTPSQTYFYTVSPYNVVGTNLTCAEETYTTAAGACLCASVPTSIDGDGINNVRLGLEDFVTTAVSYTDHSGFVNELSQGVPLNVEITYVTGFTYDTHIWIDFNDNGSLDDAGELVYSGVSLATNPTTLDADFTVPAAAALGPHKMRISSADTGQGTANSCYNGSFGVTLDFDVNISAPACTPAVIASTTAVTDCTAGTFTVEVDVTSVGTATFVVGTFPTPITSGINVVGPFTLGTTSPIISVLDVTNGACNIDFGTFTGDLSPPTALAVSNITETGADFDWTSNGSETTWEVLILAGGDPAPANTTSGTDTLTANPYTASGLTAQTDYDAYVRASCGTDPAWVGPVSFSTLCPDLVPIYTADMSLNVPDSCWDEAGSGEVVAGPGDLGASDWTTGSYAIGGSNRLNLFAGNTDREWLLSPTFDLSGGTYQLEVDVAVTNWNDGFTDDTMGSDDTVQLLQSIDGGTTWTTLTTWHAGNEPDVGGTEYIEDLSAIVGSVQFAIFATDGAVDDAEDYDFHVGKFQVRTPPSCLDVSGLTLDSFDATTAQISWTDGSGETDWEIAVQAAGTGEPGAADNSGTDTTTNPYSATGLTSATAYEVYVRADCAGDGSNLSAWLGPLNFLTLPDGPSGVTCTVGSSSIIFTEEFDTAGAWTGNINTGNDSWEIPDGATSANTGADTAFSGANYMNWEASGNNTNTGNAISPAIDLVPAVDGAELAFYMHAYGADMGTLNVGVSTTGAGGPFTTEFTWSGQLQTSGADAWTPVGVDLSAYMGSTIHIQFSQTGSGGSDFSGDMSIDLMTVEACGAYCVDPTVIVASNITGTTADIAWTENGSATDWEIAVQAAGTGAPAAADGSGTDTTTNPHSATGLTALTAYEVYVRAECTAGTTFSGWAGPYNFSTTELCPDVSDLTVDSFTDTTAEISWTNGGGTLEAGWEIVVQADGIGTPGGAGVATTSPHSETGLTAETAYEIYVRANCAGDGFSGWAGPVDFTTACSPITPDYVADLSTNAPDAGACWYEAGSGEVGDGPGGIGASDWTTGSYGIGSSNRLNLFGNTDREWLVSPSFDLSADGYELIVNVAVTNWNSSTVADTMGSDDEVQLLQSTDGGATWTNLTTWNAASALPPTGTEYTEDLTGVTGTNVQFAIMASDGTVDDAEDYDFHIGRFEVRTPPSCPDVSAITVTSITATGASIGWTNGGGDTLWEVAVQADGTGEPAAANDSGTDTASNPYSAGSLTAETAYEVYVRADCGATLGNWIGPVDFTTPCAALTPDYTADMSTNAPDAGVCWNQAANGEVATGPTGLGASLWTTGNYDAVGGSNRLNIYQGNTDREWLLSPGFDLSADGYELVVNVAVTNWNSGTVADTMGSDDEVQLLQSTDNGATWTNLTTWNAASALPPTGTEYIADLTGVTGTNVLFAIMASDGAVNDLEDYDFHVGQFVVRTPPSCPDVSTITATSITTTSADIGWTNGGSESAWEVAVQAPGTGEPAAADGSGADSATNPYNATGLSASTTYEVYVRAECTAGVEFGTWVGPFSFTTECDTFSTFPYSEGFETGVPPTCWTSFRGTNNEGTNDWTTTATANSGSAAAFVNWENSGFVQEDWLVSPEFDMTALTNPELSFYYRDAFGAAYGSSLTIRVSTTDTAHASFTTVDTYAEPDSTTYQQAVVDLSAYAAAPSIYIAFVWTNDDGDSLYIDDVFIWDNAPGTYTYTNGVWSPFTPGNDLDDIIVAAGDLVISSDLTCNTMTVNPGASTTIDSGMTLTATNGLTLESSSTSYSSLIRNGSIVGAIDYLRHINQNGSGSTGSNDLVSAPLTGQAFNVFAAANPNILNNGTLFLFGPFNKGTGQYVNWAATETATLDPGVGYRSGTTDNSTVTFTGTDNIGTITNDIQNSGPNNQEWNLVGNPYPAYLNVQNFLLNDAGPGLVNIQLFDPPTAAIYGYDGSALNGWTLYNLANTTSTTAMAPGQGFMVSANAANVAGGDLTFTPAMRRTGNTDDFIVGRNAELVYLKLNLSANNKAYTTDFYFNANATKGFDVGYDANIWGDTTPDFAVYSHLVEDNNGDAVALQALSSTDLNDVTISLGVIANQGEQLTFSIADITLPESVNVYLEDVVTNTTTLLNDSDYVITPTTALSGTGRFYLRTSQDVLSSLDNSLDNLDIFSLKASLELVVSGELLENTMLTLYDIQGRLVLSTKLDHTVLQNRIDVSSINSGVYIVNIQNDGQEKSKKVIID